MLTRDCRFLWMGMLCLQLLSPVAYGQYAHKEKDSDGEVISIFYQGMAKWMADQTDEKADFAKLYPKLAELTLSNHTVTQGQIDYICTLKNLEELALGSVGADCVKMEADLSGLSGLPKLQYLRLHWLDMDDSSIKFIEKISTLKSIDIGSSSHCLYDGEPFRLTDQVARSLLKCQKLESVYFCQETSFSDEFVHQISQLPRLTGVYLKSSNLTDKAVEILAQKCKLQYLVIHSPKLTDQGVEALRKVETLTFLDIEGGPGLTRKSMDVIKDLPNLEYVRIPSKNKTPAEIEMLNEINKRYEQRYKNKP